jgi:hypothetical protein
MRPDLATPDLLGRYLASRRRERWQMGCGAFLAGIAGIVLAIVVMTVVDLGEGRLFAWVVCAPVLVYVFAMVRGLDVARRRQLGVSADELAALHKAFERALARKQDLRSVPEDVGVAVMRQELGFSLDGATATRPPAPVFSDAQLAAWFKVQRSLQTVIALPGLVFAGIAAVTLFGLDEQWQPLGTTLSVVAAAVTGFVGHRRHRRLRRESGLSDHDLGTLRAASIRGGLTGAKGSPEDTSALRKAIAEWHQQQHGP